jgi:hypothetical protein
LPIDVRPSVLHLYLIALSLNYTRTIQDFYRC